MFKTLMHLPRTRGGILIIFNLSSLMHRRGGFRLVRDTCTCEISENMLLLERDTYIDKARLSLHFSADIFVTCGYTLYICSKKVHA